LIRPFDSLALILPNGDGARRFKTASRLWEIDENLCRADLTELERGEHLLKRKEVYERKFPQTRQHVAGAVAANEAKGNATEKSSVASFADDTAAKTGVTDDRFASRSPRKEDR